MGPRTLVLGIAFSGIAAIAFGALGACQSRVCRFDLCSDVATITAHIQATPTEFLHATTTLCRNGECSSVTPRSGDAGAGSEDDGGQFGVGGASGRVFDQGAGWSRVDFSIGGSIATSERWHVKIVTPDGRALLDVERTITSAPRKESECGPTCKSIATSLYPDSESGLSCTGNVCRIQQELSFHKTMPLRVPRPYTAQVVACINDKCSSPASFQYLGDGAIANLEGDVRGTAWFDEAEDGKTVDFNLSLGFPLQSLADGDRYRVEVTQPKTGESVIAFDDVVTYETEFPNGPACDRYPCRRLHKELP